MSNDILKGGDFDKFTVIKNDDIDRHLEDEDKEMLERILLRIGFYRRNLDNKKNEHNTYVVINTDEPYIGEIVDILKKNGHWG